MSYTENPHFHQSDILKFLPENYVPFKESKRGIKTFGVIVYEKGEFSVSYQHEVPKFGGYISSDENIYGNPTYCGNATRHHLRHKEIYGTMPHLVFFNSEIAAKKAGFRRCKICS